MNCIKSIQNLVIRKYIDFQESKADVINKPNTEETYIICTSSENPYSEKIVRINLGNARNLFDGTFSECCDEYNYVMPSSDGRISSTPFTVAIKANKKILPVYVSNGDIGERIVIAYTKPIELHDCYKRTGEFDFRKIDEYVEKCQKSIEQVKMKIKKQ
jgi:hypothetical protein